ncbi:tRNA methyltransferase [Pichia kluyveri]|uniref:tRNA wybutosine-synthesizing protein 4 n=1 Tax=Pichia kluyveri TaxID=36015 RepID=A0AAV5R0X9_PICKL|nr:tRNA methyltransferase [Pichia kluyveri]
MDNGIDVFASVTQKQFGKHGKKQNVLAKGEKGDSVKVSKNDKKTKKIVHDLFVQGTNDSSIVSKRSVEILYNPIVEPESKPYFQHFVKKSPRRSPVINRGYWIRMKSIRMAIEKIIEAQPIGQRINIINLGCGYDPLPFQLLDDQKFKDRKLYCIDVDFPELIRYKSQMINMAPELKDLIGENIENHGIPGIIIKTENYGTMGCDLTNKELYCQQLESFTANSSATTNIFIAEVSLAYMTPETANPIINTSSEFSNSHFLILEQLMPSGEHHPFAKRMINHFKKMEAPLQCVHTYPTILDQIDRFKKLGFQNVNARNLIGCWDLVPNEIKKKVHEVEAFDEWEEFIFFGQHYINLHATNQEGVEVYSTPYAELYKPLPVSIFEYNWKTEKTELPTELERKFHNCFSIKHDRLITCGSNQSRLSDTHGLNKDIQITTPKEFKGRVSAKSVKMNNAVYLIGGRRIPGIGIDEVWKLSENSNGYEWNVQKSLDSGLVKHSCVKFGDDILIYGGSNGEGFQIYSPNGLSYQLQFSDENVLLEGSEIIKLDDKYYLIGGKIFDNGSFTFNDKLYEITVDLDNKKVLLTVIMVHPVLARYGFKSFTKNDNIIIIGGVGMKLYDQFDTAIEINIPTKTISSITIDDECWATSPVFVGSSTIETDNNVWVVGGGAVCYGFGSVWNGIVSLGLETEAQTI